MCWIKIPRLSSQRWLENVLLVISNNGLSIGSSLPETAHIHLCIASASVAPKVEWSFTDQGVSGSICQSVRENNAEPKIDPGRSSVGV